MTSCRAARRGCSSATPGSSAGSSSGWTASCPSRWRSSSSDPYACTFLGRRPPGPCQADSTLLVIRQRYVGNGMREDITLRNLGREAAAAHLSLAVDGDFADLFEVKEGRRRPNGDDDDVDVRVQGGTVWLRCRRGANVGGMSVTGTGDPSATPRLLSWQAVVPSGGSWTTSVQITPSLDGQEAPERYSREEGIERSVPARRLSEWRRRSPLLHTSDERLAATFATSTEDLGSLRIFGRGHTEQDEHAVIAAGAPWFMTLFGRDSLLTSWMMLPLDPSLALGTLRTLASLQGEQEDPLTEEEPGRILHEIRSGRDASLSLGGGSVYYGTADATPLFVMLLGELARWGMPGRRRGRAAPARRPGAGVDRERTATGTATASSSTSAPPTRAWSTRAGRTPSTAINFADGTDRRAARSPWPRCRATYTRHTWPGRTSRRSAARPTWPRLLAGEGAARSGTTSTRRSGCPTRAISPWAWTATSARSTRSASNMGHCLWTGIVDEDKAAAVAEHLVVPADVHRLRDPDPGHHHGRLQPDELPQRFGLAARQRDLRGRADALRVRARRPSRSPRRSWTAADRFGGRLPELFCGFDRGEFAAPVPYPTSCSPQAWAAAAPFLLLRTLLRLDPAVPSGRVWCAPALPARMLPLRVDGLHIADGMASVEVSRRGWRVEGLPRGLELIRRARTR